MNEKWAIIKKENATFSRKVPICKPNTTEDECIGFIKSDITDNCRFCMKSNDNKEFCTNPRKFQNISLNDISNGLIYLTKKYPEKKLDEFSIEQIERIIFNGEYLN